MPTVEVRVLLFSAETDAHLKRATADEIRELLSHRFVTTANPAAPSWTSIERHLLIGCTDGGRPLTVVIEATLDPTTWLPVTVWDSSPAERKMLERG